MPDLRRRILVTGAAGFVGSHTVDLLVEHGAEVIAVDNLDPQVHGGDAEVPRHLARHLAAHAIRFVRADVRDRAVMAPLVAEADAILHLAAAVGVGQSMYQVHHYADVNVGGTALLLDLLANTRHHVGKLVVASSMSLYGEGAYRCPECGPVTVGERDPARLAARHFEHACPRCAATLVAVPTPESKPLSATSVYAVTKRVQEEMSLVFGRAYRLPTIALRYFNIYGPRQSLSNPYTGVAAIFLGRLKAGQPPVVFEDGLQSRDFIHVRDVARANLAALAAPLGEADQRVYNVGTGRSTTVLDVAHTLDRLLGTGIAPTATHQFRAGDIRHCIGDAARIAADLGFRAEVSLEDGYRDLIEWSRGESTSSGDAFAASLAELARHQLVS